ncbi:hypothetical protein LP7551_01134 [Roseibium album]|nr:hypothetical protein LP7551_01134 [Roseibium album]
MHATGRTSRHPPPGTAKDTRADNRVTTPSGPYAVNEQGRTCAAKSNPVTGHLLPNDQVHAALGRALNSTEFQSAPQLRAFLEFVVQATLTRQGEKIKGYMIAVEALGRSEDFNPVVDPIVRVEAARLRRRLKRYYEGTGATDPVRISIPKGSYAPEFRPARAGPKVEEKPEDLISPERSGYRRGLPAEIETTQAQNKIVNITGFEKHAGTSGHPYNFSIANEAIKTGTKAPPVRPPVRNSGFLVKSARQLQGILQIRISVPTAIAFGVACFVTGYFVASS